MSIIRTFDSVEEQRAGLEVIAQNIEGFWHDLAKRAMNGDLGLMFAAQNDAAALRLIAKKLGA